MVKLNVDFTATEIERLIRCRDREGAIRVALGVLASGSAGPETQKLAAGLLGKKDGAPANGLYMWLEIGEENARLGSEGMKREARLAALENTFHRGRSSLEKCIKLYEDGIAAGRE